LTAFADHGAAGNGEPLAIMLRAGGAGSNTAADHIETTRRWEPKRLRLRLFAAAGRLVRGGRRLRLRLAARWAWARQIAAAVTRLQALPSG